MSESTKEMLVPKLRFPEFQDTEEWNNTLLGNCLDYLQPTKYLVKSTAYDDSYKTPVLTAGKTFILGYTDESSGIFKKKLPAIIFDDFTTATKFVDFPFKAKSSAMKILLARENTNIKFIYEAMQAIKYEVGAHQRHWISKFTTLNIIIPPPSEQQKIADFLASIDDLITAQAKKIEVLKVHKKGLMQKLFPAEGKSIPKLRFPEFRDTKKWKKQKLEKVATFLKGRSISKSDVTTDGKQPCIRYGELYTLYNETIENISSYTNIPTNNLVMSKANDVIIPASGETQEDIATASCVINGGIALGGDLNIIRSTMNGVFLSYYLNSAKKNSIAQLSQGISVVHLYTSQLKKLDISTPALPEQQKIADCLASIDELITAQTKKIEALNVHKKGLMQQIFPTVGEVGA